MFQIFQVQNVLYILELNDSFPMDLEEKQTDDFKTT